jgi:peptidoglycan/LPS O-acetylase OafA/YrhL
MITPSVPVDQQTNRLGALDSIRGLAALSVVVYHVLLAFPATLGSFWAIPPESDAALAAVAHSPLHLFFAGREAVVLFFALSGYVLVLPFLANRANSYTTFVVKRFFRIYVPYLAMLLAYVAIITVVRPTPVTDGSSWINSMWSEPISWQQCMALILMLHANTHAVNTAAWSLIHEMRISLAFPLIAFVVVRCPARWCLMLVLGTLPLGILVHATQLARFDLDDTTRFTGMFIAGASLAKCTPKLRVGLAALPVWVKLTLGGIAWSLYISRWLVPGWDGSTDSPWATTAALDLLVGVGACLGLGLLINSEASTRLLEHRLLLWVGRISYSLYLVHIAVLRLVLSAGVLPLVLGAAAVPFLALLAAHIAHRFVESPSQEAGRWLSRRVGNMVSLPHLPVVTAWHKSS